MSTRCEPTSRGGPSSSRKSRSVRCTLVLVLSILVPHKAGATSVSSTTIDGRRPEPLCSSSANPVSTDAVGFAQGFAPNATGREKVNLVYLVPSDKAVNANYLAAIEGAGLSLRPWYREQMGNGKTFTATAPVVRVVRLPHPSAYYSTNPNGDTFIRFWNNVLGDAFALTGGTFNDPENIWAYYIDADPACGQCGGCGTSGVLVVPANDLRGLVGEATVASCPTEQPENAPANRWIGGLGHELGHAFGLPHPPGCDAGAASCDHGALMWNGFRSYPNAYLRADEKAVLNSSPFFQISEAIPTCTPSSTSLCLSGGRFRAESRWTTADGTSGQARAGNPPITNDSGYFWFFDPANVEILVKVINGCSLGSRYWVFAAGLTNVRVDLTITDTRTGSSKTYNNPQGVAFQPIQDTNAFSSCP